MTSMKYTPASCQEYWIQRIKLLVLFSDTCERDDPHKVMTLRTCDFEGPLSFHCSTVTQACAVFYFSATLESSKSQISPFSSYKPHHEILSYLLIRLADKLALPKLGTPGNWFVEECRSWLDFFSIISIQTRGQKRGKVYDTFCSSLKQISLTKHCNRHRMLFCL